MVATSPMKMGKKIIAKKTLAMILFRKSKKPA